MSENGLPVIPPHHWQVVFLPDVVDIWDKRRVPVNKSERDKRIGDIPYYGATGQAGWIDDYLFDDELVLVGEDGAPFLEPNKPKAFVIRGKSWVNNHAHVLKARDGVESVFIKHYLDILDYRPFVSGTTRLKLTQAAMRRVPVPLPCPDEQKQIVAEIETQFARLDDAIAALERARTRLKRYRASVLKAACEGRLVPTEAELARQEGRDYEPASVLLERIKAGREANPGKKRGKAKNVQPLDTSHLPKLPEGWVWAKFEESLREPLRNGHSAKTSPDGIGVPTISLTAVTLGDFSERNVKMTVADPGKVHDLWLRSGDILIQRSNTIDLVGTSRLFHGKSDFAIYPDLLIRARLSSQVNERFFEAVLQSGAARYHFRSNAQGISGSMPKISQETIEQLPVPIPPRSEQERIVAEVERRLSVIEQLEATVETNLKRAESLRQSILRLAFSGRLLS